jgi:hypothetical protein
MKLENRRANHAPKARLPKLGKPTPAIVFLIVQSQSFKTSTTLVFLAPTAIHAMV